MENGTTVFLTFVMFLILIFCPSWAEEMNRLPQLHPRHVGHCTSGQKDADETDIDCGGSCSGCEEGLSCIVDNDCLSNKCIFNICEVPVVFVQISDTHIVAGSQRCQPYFKSDGRVDCSDSLTTYVDECLEGSCQWLDEDGSSIAPAIALTDAVFSVNTIYENDFTVFTGDLKSHNACADSVSLDAFVLLKEIADLLIKPYYTIGADAHDNIDDPDCLSDYQDTFGFDSVNWNFVKRDNLFVGLSETESQGSRYDLTYLDVVLSTYQNQDMKLFIFIHSTNKCFDKAEGGDYRCVEDSILDFVKDNDYPNKYRVVVFVAGHTHANMYDTGDSDTDNIHHVVTGAIMSYPTQYRIFEIRDNSISIRMSDSVNMALDSASLEIIEEFTTCVPGKAMCSSDSDCGEKGKCSNTEYRKSPITFFGDKSDRIIFIEL